MKQDIQCRILLPSIPLYVICTEGRRHVLQLIWCVCMVSYIPYDYVASAERSPYLYMYIQRDGVGN